MSLRRRSTHETLRPGASAAARRILAGVSSTTTAPSARTDGYAVPDTENLIAMCSVTGTAPVFSLYVWGYSKVSETWFLLTAFNVGSGSHSYPIPVYGVDRVAVSVDEVTGTSPVLSLWIAAVVPA